jgi:hypothetical protein
MISGTASAISPAVEESCPQLTKAVFQNKHEACKK